VINFKVMLIPLLALLPVIPAYGQASECNGVALSQTEYPYQIGTPGDSMLQSILEDISIRVCGVTVRITGGTCITIKLREGAYDGPIIATGTGCGGDPNTGNYALTAWFDPVDLEAGTEYYIEFLNFGQGGYARLWGGSNNYPNGSFWWGNNNNPPVPTGNDAFFHLRIQDCNNNGVSDYHDVVNGTSLDCNDNGIPDECDTDALDCDQNGIPDDCQIDCNTNGYPDVCDILTGSSNDCNENGVPDECDLTSSYFNICNAPAASISNSLPPVVDLIAVPIDAGIADLDVQVDITHAWVEDLSISLEHGGVSVVLASGIPVAGANLTGTLFDDEASVPINEGSPPFSAVYQPQEALSNFDGLSMSGDWAIMIEDLAPTFDGELHSWCLQFFIADGFTDCNSNDIPDDCDIDSGLSQDCNSDGLPDECGADCNRNGVLDDCDISAGFSFDCDSDGIPDECESDCNLNGIPDDCDLLRNTSPDCNGNGTPDECEYSSVVDCNLNGVLDTCDISLGISSDCNFNDIPDECEIDTGTAADCNGNGIPDTCEFSSTTDCNSNGVLDECDILLGIAEDCDANGIPDQCDIAAGSADDNANGIPDECDFIPFVRGDTNADGSIELADVIYLLDDLFGDGAPVPCSNALDINNDDTRDISDGVYLLAYLFNNGPNPQNPFPTCGPDPTEDLLGCESFGVCQ
jgi:subtilisin-like proprotein convertase family protein